MNWDTKYKNSKASPEQKAARVREIKAAIDTFQTEELPEVKGHIREIKDNISLSSLTALKNLEKHSQEVQAVVEAVAILIGQPHQDWAHCQVMLGHPDFLPLLINFDKDAVDPRKLKAAQPYLNYMERDDFDLGALMRESEAAGHLAVWLIGITHYVDICRQLPALKAELRALQGELEALSPTTSA